MGNSQTLQTVVCRLPRVPFLRHSETLFRYLLDMGRLESDAAEVLEIGCGDNSPLRSMLQRSIASARLHQIDARPDTVAKARQRNPGGRVECMFANDMSSIDAASKDLIIAMSVFDQNPASVLPTIARQMHRVLKPGGLAVYIHNEELNAPATSASWYAQRPSQYLLPNDHWRPTNDLEYCLANAANVEQALVQIGDRGAPLRQYLQVLHAVTPPTVAANGKATVPYVAQLNPARMQQLRALVARLREQLELTDLPTSQLLDGHMAEQLFSRSNGFRVLQSGVFEIRHIVPWQEIVRERPERNCYVRGITKFGMVAHHAVPPNLAYRQELCEEMPTLRDDQVLLVGYQYGLVARRDE